MAGISNALSSSLFEDRSVAKYGNGGGDSTQTNKHRVTESTAPVFEFFPSRTTTRRWFISMERTRFQFPFGVFPYFPNSFIWISSQQGVPSWVARNESINGRHRPAPNSAIVICTFRTPVCVCTSVDAHVCKNCTHACILGRWFPSPPLQRIAIWRSIACCHRPQLLSPQSGICSLIVTGTDK